MKIIDGGRTARQTRRMDRLDRRNGNERKMCWKLRSNAIHKAFAINDTARQIHPIVNNFYAPQIAPFQNQIQISPFTCSMQLRRGEGKGGGAPANDGIRQTSERESKREGDSHKTLGTSVNLSTNIWTASAGTGDWRRRRRLDKLRDTRRGTTRQSSRVGKGAERGRCSDANWANWRIVASFSIIKCCQLCANGR